MTAPPAMPVYKSTEQRRALNVAAPGSVFLRCRLLCGEYFAGFWLGVFFGLISISPQMMYAMRPIFVRLAYTFSPRIRRSTAANGRRLFAGSIDTFHAADFGRAVVGSFYDFVYDIGASLCCSRVDLANRVASVEGDEDYRATRLQYRGAVLLTAHMGSFEVGLSALPTGEHKKIHVVFKRDRVAGFERLRLKLRQRLDVAEAAIDDGSSVWMRLREALQDDEVVAVQGDRVMPGQKGIRVPLAGGSVLLPTGPFKLALAAGSPVIPIFTIRNPNGRVAIVIHKPIHPGADEQGIERAVNEFAEILGRTLAAHPEQWLILEPAFCEDSVDCESPGRIKSTPKQEDHRA